MQHTRRLFVALTLAAAPAHATAAEVRVIVENLRATAGDVLAAVCTVDTFLEPDCPYENRTAVAAGDRVEVVLSGVEPGLYAVQAFHDRNGNGKIDRGWFGVPTEGIAFSNDARIHLGPPEFEDAAVRVERGSARVLRMRMRYFGEQ